ncbi:metal ABC transporter solute-binding protein, Zn/Mn family [Microbacterium nymphoidis]|uniref:metal ABC transporter solute-binding protein, Zn/Mn family n=1 Tax=Microbacterium nymphoidis TaxID=2898586 RepID=UPI001E589192|nr:zinc ABC transporter substrate-binding protein [Microbacterium nymphoidis]MCD2499937.1 zinc ABC transporter substrate-binding protein [Microbacterium nymphoidis]
MTSRRVLLIAPLALSIVALAGCSSAAGSAVSTDDATNDPRPHVLATTNVYADIVTAIGADDVVVDAIITNAAQDPHEYEVAVGDKLLASHADLFVMNGGGYDSYMPSLIPEGAPVIVAAESASDAPDVLENEHDHSDHAAEEDHDHATESADDHDHDHATESADDHDHATEGADGEETAFNEHVWYDPDIMRTVADQIAAELGKLDPAHASDFEKRAAEFGAGIDELDTQLAEAQAQYAGKSIFVTEPVPLRLTDRMGLVNETPSAFSEAVEEGQDVPPATLLASLKIIQSGTLGAVIVNAQTGGSETTQVSQEAEKEGVPVVEFAELLPEGQSYLTWMKANITALTTDLARGA